jgi:hypothetical protein
VQQTASLHGASSSGTSDERLCVARGEVLAATLAAGGGSGGRSSLCVRQHEGMINHTKPGGVKDLALNVLRTHHDDQHVKALVEEASGQTGSPRKSSSVLQPMAANEFVDALLCPAQRRAPATDHKSQIEAQQHPRGCWDGPPRLCERVYAHLGSSSPPSAAPEIVTALTAVYGSYPADRVLQLDLLRAAVELRQDPGAGLGVVERSQCNSSDRGGYLLGESRSDENMGPPATDRLRDLWQAAARSIEAAIDDSLEGGAGRDGIPLAVREFLTDGSMYRTQHASCCAFHAEQRLRMLAHTSHSAHTCTPSVGLPALLEFECG